MPRLYTLINIIPAGVEPAVHTEEPFIILIWNVAYALNYELNNGMEQCIMKS